MIPSLSLSFSRLLLDFAAVIREWSLGKKKKVQYHIMACLTIPSVLACLPPAELAQSLASTVQLLLDFWEGSARSSPEKRQSLTVAVFNGLRVLLDSYLRSTNGSFENADPSNAKAVEISALWGNVFQRVVTFGLTGLASLLASVRMLYYHRFIFFISFCTYVILSRVLYILVEISLF
jgi:hypothetical protein